MHLPEPCAKTGCRFPATMLVLLHAADGDAKWWACLDHARLFREWVEAETHLQGKQLQWVEVTRLSREA